MELHELHILEWEPSAGHHSRTVSSDCVGGCAGEVAASGTTGSQDCILGSDSVDSSIGHGHGDDATAFSVDHDEVKDEVFNEEGAVIGEGLAEEGMQ
jgi:hypothetical protein